MAACPVVSEEELPKVRFELKNSFAAFETPGGVGLRIVSSLRSTVGPSPRRELDAAESILAAKVEEMRAFTFTRATSYLSGEVP